MVNDENFERANNHVTTHDNDVKNNKKIKRKKIPKEISQEILKDIFTNLIKAIIITIYFIVLNVAYFSMKEERLVKDIEIFATTFLAIGIVFIEKAYKKDNSCYAQTGVEFLVLSLHSLSIMHVITQFKYDFRLYLLTSSYVVSIYYVLKAIILYTKGRRQYLHSLSDIPEIVKKDEPIIREAKKRKIEINQERPTTKTKKATNIKEIEKPRKKSTTTKSRTSTAKNATKIPKENINTEKTKTTKTTRKKKETIDDNIKDRPKKTATTRKTTTSSKTTTTRKTATSTKSATSSKSATTRKKTTKN